MDLLAQVGERISGEGLDNYCNRANFPTLSKAVIRRDPLKFVTQAFSTLVRNPEACRKNEDGS
jgi:hypothetical protein